MVLSVRGLGVQGPRLQNFERLDLHGSPSALNATMTFDSIDTAEDWQGALEEHLERLQKFQALPRQFALPAPVRTDVELTYRGVPATTVLHLALARPLS